MNNQLHFGDNLEVLRGGAIRPDSVDLIYLDPPFNSAVNYNMLFREPEGFRSQAQIEAFEDTWKWGLEAEEAFDDVMGGENARLASLLNALRDSLGDNDMMAYLAMMAVRLVELHRVLKDTGSLFLHCDPTASHYLKIILDAVFGPKCFRNEIVWDYSFRLMDLPHFFNRKHDVILFYAKSKRAYFKMPKTEWTREALQASRKQKIHVDEQGIEWIWMPGGTGNSKSRLKRVDEILAGGKAMSDVWQIPIISSSSHERLGYPTQKPLALLERVIECASKEGDVILDPFCGCGTTIHAAQRMGRKWIGIDVTHLAISLIESRVVSAFPDVKYDLIGTPKDLSGARALGARNKHQFELWALSLVKAQPGNDRKKGADHGIDGVLWVRINQRERAKVIVSVKGGFSVSVPMVRDLIGVLDREKAAIGLFVTLHPPTGPMKVEAAKAGFYNCDGERYPRVQILTVEELLDGKKADLPLVDHAAMRPIAKIDRREAVQPGLL